MKVWEIRFYDMDKLFLLFYNNIFFIFIISIGGTDYIYNAHTHIYESSKL